MPSYKIHFTKEAVKDFKKLSPKIKAKLKTILSNTLMTSPYSGKKLLGDLEGLFSLRLTFQDRIVYSIDENNKAIYIHRTKTHYGE
ncbi:MAG: type II toxin-antitoxin system RelE/ParE family toxin [Gammaproteobacteria bacterium]|nr:type II toxin-antitoxin system RelE/ParE family toxin [Gammaproteobacteria bacterium]